MTAKPGDIVLYHFDTRVGLVSRPALVIVAHDDAEESCELQVFVGTDHDLASDLAEHGVSTLRVPLCLADEPTAGTYTERS